MHPRFAVETLQSLNHLSFYHVTYGFPVIFTKLIRTGLDMQPSRVIYHLKARKIITQGTQHYGKHRLG